jgi:hypothetical protein
MPERPAAADKFLAQNRAAASSYTEPILMCPFRGGGEVEVSFPNKVEVSFPGKVEESFPGKVEVSFPGKVEGSFPDKVEECFPGKVDCRGVFSRQLLRRFS